MGSVIWCSLRAGPKEIQAIQTSASTSTPLTDGRKQDRAPEGSKPDGVIDVANAIKNMGALTSLNQIPAFFGGAAAYISYYLMLLRRLVAGLVLVGWALGPRSRATGCG
jgi:hypothetical protein